MLPPLWFPMVDVRDVARSHLFLLEHAEASGRFLVCNGHFWLMQLADVLRGEFPDRPIPSRTLPVWLFKIVGRFDKRMDRSLLYENTVEGLHVDTGKIEGLGFKYEYDIPRAAIDHARSLVEHGLLAK